MQSVIIVAFGGRSTERDISIITGVMALNALRGTGEIALPVYIDENGVWQTAPFMNDVTAFSSLISEKSSSLRRALKQVVFCFGRETLYLKKGNKLRPYATVRAAVNCLHGKNGEDGVFPAIMKECRIPVTSPGMTESAVLMDKWYAKLAFSALGVPVLPHITFGKEDFFSDIKAALSRIQKTVGFPACIKPARLGSSIGISVAEGEDAAAEGAISAFRYDGRILVEPALCGFAEYSLAVYKKEGILQFGAPQKQIPSQKIYTFAEKYLKQGGYFGTASQEPPSCNAAVETDLPLFPQETLAGLTEQMRIIAERVYRGMRLSGVVRMDFLEKDGALYLNEINAVPGSLSYYFFASSPNAAGAFLLDLVRQGVADFRQEESELRSYPSSVLTALGRGKKGGKLQK